MIFDIILLISSLVSSFWLILQVIYFNFSSRYIRNLTEVDKYKNNEENYFSIIVAVKNEEKEVINELIENLRSLDWNKYEVIIVSDDDESRFNYIFHNVDIPTNFKIIRREGIRDKKAGALNLASKIAVGKYLVFLDADARVERDFLRKLNGRIKGINALRLEIRNKNEGEVPRIYSSMNEFIMNSLFKGRYVLGLPIFPNGSALVIDKKVLERIGYWKNYIAEDLELGIRVFYNSLNIDYIDEVKVRVLSPFTYTDLYKQIERWAYGAGELFFNSFKLLKRGLRGIEGAFYVSQWFLNGFFFLILVFLSSFQPILHINYMTYLISLIIYSLSLILYQRYSKVEGNIRIAILTLFASIIGYLKGILRLRYSWKVTRKVKESNNQTFPLSPKIIGYLAIFASYINALYSEWFSSIILLSVGFLLITEATPF